jgi:hypothetical protein
MYIHTSLRFLYANRVHHFIRYSLCLWCLYISNTSPLEYGRTWFIPSSFLPSVRQKIRLSCKWLIRVASDNWCRICLLMDTQTVITISLSTLKFHLILIYALRVFPSAVIAQSVWWIDYRRDDRGIVVWLPTGVTVFSLFHNTQRFSGNSLDSYSEGDKFDSLPRTRLYWDFFMIFLSPSRQMLG